MRADLKPGQSGGRARTIVVAVRYNGGQSTKRLTLDVEDEETTLEELAEDVKVNLFVEREEDYEVRFVGEKEDACESSRAVTEFCREGSQLECELVLLRAIGPVARVLVIGVSGAAQAGKTTLSEILAIHLGCRVVTQDRHLGARRANEELGAYLVSRDSTDWNALVAEVEDARAQPGARFVVLEGTQIYYEPRLLEACDLALYVNAEESVLADRLLQLGCYTAAFIENKLLPAKSSYEAHLRANAPSVLWIEGESSLQESVEQFYAALAKLN